MSRPKTHFLVFFTKMFCCCCCGCCLVNNEVVVYYHSIIAVMSVHVLVTAFEDAVIEVVVAVIVYLTMTLYRF